MRNKPKTPSSPGTDDMFVLEPSAERASSGRFADRINRYLKTLFETDDDADEHQKRVLEELRSEAGEAVVALAKAEAGCKPHDYPQRWALVYAATRMDHDAALPYLRELVLTPIPPSKAGDAHHFSVAREETILRTTAIEGIGRLAERGNQQALDALFEFLDTDSISVCRASTQAILSVNPDYRDRVAERIPSKFHYLLDVRPAQVKEIPQVKDPKKHLKDKKMLGTKPRPPKLATPKSPKQPKQRSPKLRGK